MKSTAVAFLVLLLQLTGVTRVDGVPFSVLTSFQDRILQTGGDDDDFLCSICGTGNMITMPDAMVEVPTEEGFAAMSCQELDDIGKSGGISSIECPLIQSFVQDLCGCVDVEEVAPNSSATSDGSPAEESTIPTSFNNPSSAAVTHFHSLIVPICGVMATLMISSMLD